MKHSLKSPRNIRLLDMVDDGWAVFFGRDVRICETTKEMVNLLNREAPNSFLYKSEELMCPICCCDFINLDDKTIERTECPDCGHNF